MNFHEEESKNSGSLEAKKRFHSVLSYQRIKMVKLLHHEVMLFPIQLYQLQLLLKHYHKNAFSEDKSEREHFNWLVRNQVHNNLPVVIVGGAVNTRSLPYVVFSCVAQKYVEPHPKPI